LTGKNAGFDFVGFTSSKKASLLAELFVVCFAGSKKIL
jgi:hypothetical protein